MRYLSTNKPGNDGGNGLEREKREQAPALRTELSIEIIIAESKEKSMEKKVPMGNGCGLLRRCD